MPHRSLAPQSCTPEQGQSPAPASGAQPRSSGALPKTKRAGPLGKAAAGDIYINEQNEIPGTEANSHEKTPLVLVADAAGVLAQPAGQAAEGPADEAGAGLSLAAKAAQVREKAEAVMKARAEAAERPTWLLKAHDFHLNYNKGELKYTGRRGGGGGGPRPPREVDWDLVGEWRAAGCPDVPRGKARPEGYTLDTEPYAWESWAQAGKPPASEQREDELLRQFERMRNKCVNARLALSAASGVPVGTLDGMLSRARKRCEAKDKDTLSNDRYKAKLAQMSAKELHGHITALRPNKRAGTLDPALEKALLSASEERYEELADFERGRKRRAM